MSNKTSMRVALQYQVEHTLELAECLAELGEEIGEIINTIEEIPPSPRRELQRVVSKTNNKAKSILQKTSSALKRANFELSTPAHTVRLALTET